MGRSSPSPGQYYSPAPAPATVYQSVVPEQDYGAVAERLKRIQGQTDTALAQRYQEVGTPAELGARQAGRRVQEAASYLAAIPTSDKYLKDVTGIENKFMPAKTAAEETLSDAQKQYAEALKKATEKPGSVVTPTPEWGSRA